MAGRPLAAARLERVGLQLYTLREAMAEDPVGTIARVAGMGFDEVEFAGYHGLGHAEVRQALANAGLTAPAAHAGLRQILDDSSRWIETCAEIGHRYLVLAYLQPHERERLDQYKSYADALQKVGEACRAAGIQLAYHNHDFEFVSLEGTVPYELLLGTDPELVEMELDLFWITKAGADPLRYFDAHPGRFTLFHVKDLHADTGTFTEVGSGTVPFARIFAAREKAGLRHAFVEQDVIRGDVWASLRQSLGYVRNLEL